MVGEMAVVRGDVPVLTPVVLPVVLPVTDPAVVPAGFAPTGWAGLPVEAFLPVVEAAPVPVLLFAPMVPVAPEVVVPEVWELVPDESDPPLIPVVAPWETPALPAVVPAEALDPAVWAVATPSESTKTDGIIQSFFINSELLFLESLNPYGYERGSSMLLSFFTGP